MTRTQLIDAYLAHADEYYRRPDGTPTGHAANLELALRSLRSRKLAKNFGLADLIRYRDELIGRGLARKTVNQWCGWVRGAFRWAARNSLVPVTVPAELALVDPLRYGRGGARESRPRGLLTLDELVRVADAAPGRVGDMLRVQWLGGMRPSEVVNMRSEDLDEYEQWLLYRPRYHKTQHFGRVRVVVLCPEAAEIIRGRSAEGPVFPTRLKAPYTADSYGQAVRRTCKRLGGRVWTPALVRRSAATYARRMAGAEAAQRLLGHASADMTEKYYELELIDAVQACIQLLAVGWSLDIANS